MSRKNIIFIVIAAAILIPLLIYMRILPGRNAPAPQAAGLSFWGLQEDAQMWRDIIQKFQDANKNITVTFTGVSEQTYEQTLLNKLAASSGPDVFLLKNTQLIKHRDKIFPRPVQVLPLTAAQVSQIFVDGLIDDLVTPKGFILALPLNMDTPVLFYNKDILNAASIANPPKNWDELVAMSRQLTAKTPANQILHSGLAIGTFKNVENAQEILASLMLQYGDPIARRKPDLTPILSDKAIAALTFYTSFANPRSQNFSWSDRMPDSFTAFAEGNAAFVIGFAGDLARIQARNPHVAIGILPFPQLKDVRIPAVNGRYVVATVSRSSLNAVPAWMFVDYITQGNGAKMYLETTQRPPAHRGFIAAGPKNPDFLVWYRQALVARTWPVPDEQPTKNLFREAIEAVVDRDIHPAEAMQNLRGRLGLLYPVQNATP